MNGGEQKFIILARLEAIAFPEIAERGTIQFQTEGNTILVVEEVEKIV